MLDLIEKLGKEIKRCEYIEPIIKMQRKRMYHNKIAEIYSWQDVASRTEKIYEECDKKTSSLLLCLKQYYGMGNWSGKFWCLIVACNFLIIKFFQFLKEKP